MKPATNPAIDSFVSFLQSSTSRIDLDLLKQKFEALTLSIADLAPYVQFNDQHYQRNLVSHSQWFDLFVICWRPGQRSTIHDHGSSSCGFLVMYGDASETVFSLSDPYRSLVTAQSAHVYRQREICLAHDSDIHRIENESSRNDLITLHVYSPPLHMRHYEELASVGAAPPPPDRLAITTTLRNPH